MIISYVIIIIYKYNKKTILLTFIFKTITLVVMIRTIDGVTFEKKTFLAFLQNL